MEMIDEKVEKFQKNCYDTATAEANGILNNIKNEIDANIKQELEDYKQEMSQNYERKIRKLEHSYNSEVFKLNNDSRHAVIDREIKLKKELKEKVIEKIANFKNSNEYKKFILRNIEQAIKSINTEKDDDIDIYVTQKDYDDFCKDIQNEFNYNIKCMDSNNIGGCICENKSKNISVNNTLKILIDNYFAI